MNTLEKARFFFTDYISGYSLGDPYRNGEYRFISKFLEENMIVFDVGANVGDYSNYLINKVGNIKIHAFEPVSSTFKSYTTNITNINVTANNFALSNFNGEADINVYHDNSGMNSLFKLDYAIKANPNFLIETISLRTLDSYVNDNGIERIDLLKIDVEGNEVNVLRGAKLTLEKGLIKCIQFEYGGSFKDAGEKIEEIFSMLLPKGFKFYRLTPWGKISISKFYPKLENYKHSNYVEILF